MLKRAGRFPREGPKGDCVGRSSTRGEVVTNTMPCHAPAIGAKPQGDAWQGLKESRGRASRPRWRRRCRSEGRGPSHGASAWPLRYPWSPSPASSTKRLHNASSRSGRNPPQRRSDAAMQRCRPSLPLPTPYHASMHVPPLHLIHLLLVWTLRTPPCGLCTAMARGTGQVTCKQSVPTATRVNKGAAPEDGLARDQNEGTVPL
jgi:hypothetical protein